MSGSFNDDPFSVSVARWVDRAKAKQDLVLQAIAQDALARIKELTPVNTGYLRANWTVIAGGTAQAIAGGGDRTEESLAVIVALKAGDTFTILNPVVYARRINFGFQGTDSLGRTYDQKGVHMLEQVITEMPEISRKAAARVAQQS